MRHAIHRHLITGIVLLALMLNPCRVLAETCDPAKFNEAMITLRQNGDFIFKFWIWLQTPQMRRLFDEVGNNKDIFMFRAVQMYTHSKFSKVADKTLFVAKISLFAVIMWAVAYVQSTWFTEGPAQNFISAVLGGVVFSFVHPFLGPVYEKIYNKARIDAFRSMTGKITTLDPWLLKRFSEYYKRTNAALDPWQIWTRDDIGILLIRLQQYIQQAISLYIAYKRSPPDPTNPFSKEEAFHDPIALALIVFVRLYPDYAAEPDFILDEVLSPLIDASYFDNKDLKPAVVDKCLRRMDPHYVLRKPFYDKALSFLQSELEAGAPTHPEDSPGGNSP